MNLALLLPKTMGESLDPRPKRAIGPLTGKMLFCIFRTLIGVRDEDHGGFRNGVVFSEEPSSLRAYRRRRTTDACPPGGHRQAHPLTGRPKAIPTGRPPRAHPRRSGMKKCSRAITKMRNRSACEARPHPPYFRRINVSSAAGYRKTLGEGSSAFARPFTSIAMNPTADERIK